MKIRVISIFLCLTIFLLPSCGQNNDAANPNFGGEISLFAYTPDTLNPLQTAYKTNASLLTATVYATPLKVNPDFSYSPCLAEKWQFSDDGYTCTMQIQSNVFFSDGTPLTAAHICCSIEEVKKHPENLYYAVSEYVESCTANGNTLTLNLKIPGTGVLAYMNFPVIKDTSSLLGCGLYTIGTSDKNGLILNAVTDPNAIYKPNIETIRVRYYPKSEMWVNGFLASETDVIAADMSVLSKLSSKTNITAQDFTTNTFTYIAFNQNSTIITDQNARKAIGYLIDKNALIESLFVGYATPTNSPFKPNTLYAHLYNGDFNANQPLAKQYLEQSSAAPNMQFSILINEESDTKKKIAEYICDKLNQNGMQVSVTALPYEEYMEKIDTGDYTVYIGQVNMTADQDLRFLLHSSQNNLGYNSSYMDTLLDGFASTTNEKQKKVYAQEIQKQLLEQVPIISLYYESNVLLVSEKIQGEFSPLPDHLYNGLETWIAAN